MNQQVFSVTGQLQMFEGKAAWTYLPIPFEKVPPVIPGGWGSIPIIVRLGSSTWKTSMFPLRKEGYFLPIKKSVFKKENNKEGDRITVTYSLAV